MEDSQDALNGAISGVNKKSRPRTAKNPGEDDNVFYRRPSPHFNGGSKDTNGRSNTHGDEEEKMQEQDQYDEFGAPRDVGLRNERISKTIDKDELQGKTLKRNRTVQNEDQNSNSPSKDHEKDLKQRL